MKPTQKHLLGLDNYAHSFAIDRLHDVVGDLSSDSLLQLQAAAGNLRDASQLA